MEFNLNDTIRILSNTPSVIASYLNNVPKEWVNTKSETGVSEYIED